MIPNMLNIHQLEPESNISSLTPESRHMKAYHTLGMPGSIGSATHYGL